MQERSPGQAARLATAVAIRSCRREILAERARLGTTVATPPSAADTLPSVMTAYHAGQDYAVLAIHAWLAEHVSEIVADTMLDAWNEHAERLAA